MLCKTSRPSNTWGTTGFNNTLSSGHPWKVGAKAGKHCVDASLSGSPPTKDRLGFAAHADQRATRKPSYLSSSLPLWASFCLEASDHTLFWPPFAHISTQARALLKLQTLGPSSFTISSCHFVFPALVSNLPLPSRLPELFSLQFLI